MARAAFVLGLVLLPALAGADPARVRSRSGHVAEIRTVAEGSEALFVDGREVWREAGPARVTSAPCWSKSGHGVAFLRSRGGATKLVVVLVAGETAGNILSWSVPPRALPARSVTWLGHRRLAVGDDELAPRLIASWDER